MKPQIIPPPQQGYFRLALSAAIVVSLFLVQACATHHDGPALTAKETGRARILFLQCRACHAVAGEEDSGRLGPSLAGVFGRKAGKQSSYEGYSAAMKESEIVWDLANMDAFLTNPAELIPGTLMAFAGIDNPSNRELLVRYLKSITEAPSQ